MRIRRFRNEDASAVSHIIRRCLSLLSDNYSTSERSFMRAAYTPEKLIGKSERGPMIVAVEDGTVLGTARLDGDTVSTIYVDPTVHLEGIGSKLLARIENLAKRSGTRSLRVESTVSATGFYEQNGYTRVRAISSDDYGTMIEMQKEL